MLRCQFLCHVLKAKFFIEIALKLSYFCKTMQKFSSARGAASRTHWPLAAGGKAPPIANFWLRAWLRSYTSVYHCNKVLVVYTVAYSLKCYFVPVKNISQFEKILIIESRTNELHFTPLLNWKNTWVKASFVFKDYQLDPTHSHFVVSVGKALYYNYFCLLATNSKFIWEVKRQPENLEYGKLLLSRCRFIYH